MTFFTILTIVEWAIRLIMVPVILRRRFPSATYAVTWLSVIFFIPEIGLIFYLMFGSNRLGRKRVKLHRQVILQMRSDKRLAGQKRHIHRPTIDDSQLPLILQAEQIGGMQILGGNHVELINDYRVTVDRLIADIDAATHHVHLLFYIFADDQTGRRVAEALVRAQKRGVQCKVLADAAASRATFHVRGLVHYFQQNQIRAIPMLPVNPIRRKLARLDLRNHRKVAIIDGRIGYTGSQNIVNPDYGLRNTPNFVDLMGRFTGLVVNQLQIVFLEDWAFETGEELDDPAYLPDQPATGDVSAQTVPTGPSEDEVDALPRVLLTAFHAARRRIVITTPYLVPDEPTFLALAMAADRGVEVDLVVPERCDHPLVDAAAKSYYEPLMKAGINLHLHQNGILHAKTTTVDDSFALLGTSNMDIRSFYLNFEVNVLMYGAPVTRALRAEQMRYIQESRKLTLEQWMQRPSWRRYLDSAAALLSPLL